MLGPRVASRTDAPGKKERERERKRSNISVLPSLIIDNRITTATPKVNNSLLTLSCFCTIGALLPRPPCPSALVSWVAVALSRSTLVCFPATATLSLVCAPSQENTKAKARVSLPFLHLSAFGGVFFLPLLHLHSHLLCTRQKSLTPALANSFHPPKSFTF
jgi:hypothetical protein